MAGNLIHHEVNQASGLAGAGGSYGVPRTLRLLLAPRSWPHSHTGSFHVVAEMVPVTEAATVFTASRAQPAFSLSSQRETPEGSARFLREASAVLVRS